jgi:hypothetical protein
MKEVIRLAHEWADSPKEAGSEALKLAQEIVDFLEKSDAVFEVRDAALSIAMRAARSDKNTDRQKRAVKISLQMINEHPERYLPDGYGLLPTETA